jgi:hypothetical protein
MTREVITSRDIEARSRRDVKEEGSVVEPTEADRYRDRLLKYIPAEVVALYVLLQGIVEAGVRPEHRIAIMWGIFIVLVIATWFYLLRVQHVSKVQQLIISTVAFCIWVFALGGPFKAFPWYLPVYGQIVMPIYTFAVAIVEAEK